MVSPSDLGDRPQWSAEFPILLTIPRFPRGTCTHGLLVRSGRPAPMVARVPDPPHDPEIPPRDRHQWSPRPIWATGPNGRPSSRSSSRPRDSPEGPAPMVSSSDLGDRPQWSPEFPIFLKIPRFPLRGRHPWSPRHQSPCVHLRVCFATTSGPVAAFGPWLGLARSFLEFLGVSWIDLLPLSSSPDRRSWDSPPARGSASGPSSKCRVGARMEAASGLEQYPAGPCVNC